MSNDFSQQVDKIVINTEARMLAVARQSIQETIEDMQTPVAKGGKMRVKTGFLRSSGLSSLNTVPAGPGRGDKNGTFNFTGEQLAATLLKMKLGDIFIWGWTANYARYRERYDGFLEAGLQNWGKHVQNAVQFFRNKDLTR